MKECQAQTCLFANGKGRHFRLLKQTSSPAEALPVISKVKSEK